MEKDKKDQQDLPRDQTVVLASSKSDISAWVQLVLVLIFILSLFACGGVVWLFNQQRVRQHQWQAQQGAWNTAASVRQHHLQNFQNDIKRRLDGQSQVIHAVEQHLAQVAKQRATGMSAVTLAELDYLVRVASWQVNRFSPVSRVKQLIDQAVTVIDRSHDARLQPLREALKQDWQIISSRSQLNLRALVAQLDTLSNQVNGLPMLPGQQRQLDKKVSEVISAKESPQAVDHSWRGFLNAVAKQLKTLVVVKRTDLPAPMLLNDQQSQMVRLQLRNKLNQAQWALLYGDQALWKNSLAQVSQIGHQYFSGDQALVQDFLQLVNRLYAINFPGQIKLSHSLSVLNQLENQFSQTPENPVVDDRLTHSAVTQENQSKHLSTHDQHSSLGIFSGGVT